MSPSFHSGDLLLSTSSTGFPPALFRSLTLGRASRGHLPDEEPVLSSCLRACFWGAQTQCLKVPRRKRDAKASGRGDFEGDAALGHCPWGRSRWWITNRTSEERTVHTTRGPLIHACRSLSISTCSSRVDHMGVLCRQVANSTAPEGLPAVPLLA